MSVVADIVRSMKLVSTRIITADVPSLVGFYELVTGAEAVWANELFAEIPTPVGTLAIGSDKTHCRTGTCGITWSTRCAAVRDMLRGQTEMFVESRRRPGKAETIDADVEPVRAGDRAPAHGGAGLEADVFFHRGLVRWSRGAAARAANQRECADRCNCCCKFGESHHFLLP